MIADRNLDPLLLEDFLKEVSGDLSLDEPLRKMGITVTEYAAKLAAKGTIAYYMMDNRCVSCVMGYTHDTPDDGSYITQVATLPEYRNQGLTSMLLHEFLVKAKQDGLHYVWLTTGQDNISAQHIYEKNGFINIGTYTNPLTGNVVLKYECRLEEI